MRRRRNVGAILTKTDTTHHILDSSITSSSSSVTTNRTAHINFNIVRTNILVPAKSYLPVIINMAWIPLRNLPFKKLPECLCLVLKRLRLLSLAFLRRSLNSLDP